MIRMVKRNLSLEEVKVIADFVASIDIEKQRWMLFSYSPDADLPIGFSTPNGIAPADLIKIARYILDSAEKCVRELQAKKELKPQWVKGQQIESM
jgi:hypothetical protein